MRKRPLTIVAFLLLLYIGPMILTSSYSHAAILAEPNMVKDFAPEINYKLASGESWLSGWTYRLKHNISGSAGAGTDYNVKIQVWYDEVTAAAATNGIGQPTNEACRPMAIYYNNATYIVWQGGDDTPDIFIRFYNHTSETWINQVNVAWSGVTDDAHMAPAITVDANGYLHIFWFHDSVGTHYKSDNPEDISSWTQQADMAPAWSSYPKVIAHGNMMYMFYQTSDAGAVVTRDIWVTISDDNGATWDGGQQLVLNSTGTTDYGNYQGPLAWNYTNTIHTVWQHVEVQAGPEDMWRRHVFHAYYNIDDAHMYNITGYDLGTEITYAEAMSSCLVVNTGTGMNMSGALPDVYLDDDGQPWISYTAGLRNTEPITYDGNFTLYQTRWNGTGWAIPLVVTNTGHAFNYMCLNYRSDTDVDAYAVVSPWGGVDYWGGDIEKWNWDGGTWSKNRTVMRMNYTGVPLQYPNIPYNKSLYLQLVFVEEILNDFTGDLRVYVLGICSLLSSLGMNDQVSVCGNAKADFSDLRFTDDDGETLLDYWISEYEELSYADVWIKISDNLDNDVIIYMYYGNEAATSLSDAASTVIKYDDGVTGNLDNATAGDTSIAHADGKLSVTMDSADDAFAIGGINTGWNKYMSVIVDPHTGNASVTGTTKWGYYDAASVDDLLGELATVYYLGRFFILRYHASDGSYENQTIIAYINPSDTVYYWDAATGWETTLYRYDSNGILEYRMWDDGTTLYADIISSGRSIFVGLAGPPSIAISSVKAFSNGIVHALAEHYTDAYYFYTLTADNYLVRNYTSPEPIQGLWGDWEEEAPPQWNLVGTAILYFSVLFDMWGFDTALIILGLVMIPTSTIYLAYGIKHDRSSNRLFYGLIIFFLGFGLLIGGIMP